MVLDATKGNNKPQDKNVTAKKKGTSKLTSRGMGASGEAKIHTILFSSRKRAYDAALNAGQGKPILHRPHTQGDRCHFHSADKNGEKIVDGKIGGVHYQFGEIHSQWYRKCDRKENPKCTEVLIELGRKDEEKEKRDKCDECKKKFDAKPKAKAEAESK